MTPITSCMLRLTAALWLAQAGCTSSPKGNSPQGHADAGDGQLDAAAGPQGSPDSGRADTGTGMGSGADAGADAGLPEGRLSPIQVRFVGFARGIEQVTEVRDAGKYRGCPLIEKGGATVLTACMLQTHVDRMNRELETLTGQRPFIFGGYMLEPYSLWHEVPDPTTGALDGFLRAHYLTDGIITVLVPDLLEGASGRAAVGQTVTGFNGGMLTVSADAFGRGTTFLHEFGHLLGAPHFDEVLGQTVADCDGARVPEAPTGCFCERNYMAAFRSDVPGCMPECITVAPSFDTPHFGAVMRAIAACWVDAQLIGEQKRCNFKWSPGDDMVECRARGDATECTCPPVPGADTTTFTVTTCEGAMGAEGHAMAEKHCAVIRCSPAGRPDIPCVAIGEQSWLECTCPEGAVLYANGRDDCDQPNAWLEDACVRATLKIRCEDTPAKGPNLTCEGTEGESGVLCTCPDYQQFPAPSCGPDDRAARLDGAQAVCDWHGCEIPGRPDIACNTLGARGDVPCTCPDGATFLLPGDCHGADFADGITALCGAL